MNEMYCVFSKITISEGVFVSGNKVISAICHYPCVAKTKRPKKKIPSLQQEILNIMFRLGGIKYLQKTYLALALKELS